MPFGRFIISARPIADLDSKNAIVNTIYFNISNDPITPTDWQNLVNDLYVVWANKSWAGGQTIDIRAYDMGDAEPRPQKARKVGNTTGAIKDGPPQVALALSYYADRNLPRHRGRIFIGPWANPARAPTSTQQNEVLSLAQGFADLGGVNVDWSLWSPTTQEHTRINHAWCDNSWDIIRSRKLKGSSRVTWTGNG